MGLFNHDENNFWIPDEMAQGPFQGLHGGGLAALMCAELDPLAVQNDLGKLASISVQFLKPTQNASFRTKPRILKAGRRSSVLVNEIRVDGTTTAMATVNYIAPISVSVIEALDTPSCDPERYEVLASIPSPSGRPWMMDALEVRPGEDGIVWFKQLLPLVDTITILETVLIVSDWAHGLNRPKGPHLADPNVNLNVSLVREPVGEYIGVRGAAQWTDSGIGIGSGWVFDQKGQIGNVSMSTALSPIS